MKFVSIPFLLLFAITGYAQFITNNGIAITNSALVYTNGEWTNDAGSMIVNDGSIITSENWINSGVLADSSKGGFVLNYAASNTFIPGGNGLGYLKADGPADINIGLRGELLLKDSLVLKNGILRVSAEPGSPESPILALNAGAQVEAGNTSFVDGVMARKGEGDLLFPLGKTNLYLPVTFYKVGGTDVKVIASLEDAPTGYTAGAGVNALIDFPYVWKTTKSNAADTAAYVEIEYPNTLPTAADVVVVRKVTGQDTYQGMGARSITTTANTVKVRSYSRGLQGMFSIARGFPGNLETDSLALVALYQSTSGSAWTSQTNWNTGRVSTWLGVTETGGQVTSVVLPNNNLKGPLPDSFVDMAALQTVNLSGNEITRLPNLTSSTGILTLDVSSNRLGFGSLIPNINIPGFTYSNQSAIDDDMTALPEVGTDYKVKAITDGSDNVYQWKYNDVTVPGATDSTYVIPSIGRSNMGDYVAEITNPAVPDLTLKTGTRRVLATATLAGKLFEDTSIPVENGKVTLFKINPTGGFDTTVVKSVTSLGEFTLEKMVLDDYILLGESDTAQYQNDLPTYFLDKIYWEEADTLFINENRTDLNITMQKEPVEKPQGTGIISGIFEDTALEPGGRTLNKRISSAGVSVRRVSRTSRPQEEILTLVAYIFTNDNGEFEFANLEEGEYLLNLQYPGYPMDPNSFINITIGTGLDRRVSVEALVQENKIVVNKLVITGWDESEKRFSVYPNPTSTSLNIDVNEKQEGFSYLITNSMGSEVVSGGLTFGSTAIDVSRLATGIYHVQINQGSATVKTFRIIIQ